MPKKWLDCFKFNRTPKDPKHELQIAVSVDAKMTCQNLKKGNSEKANLAKLLSTFNYTAGLSHVDASCCCHACMYGMYGQT